MTDQTPDPEPTAEELAWIEKMAEASVKTAAPLLIAEGRRQAAAAIRAMAARLPDDEAAIFERAARVGEAGTSGL